MTSIEQVNPAVRGIRNPSPVRVLAECVLQQMIQRGEEPFIDVSSGDAHGSGMAPISFVRQVLAISLYPELLEDESLPQDVRQRAQKLLSCLSGGSVGSYCPSMTGIPHVQKSVADFITRRDGVQSNADDIIIFPGCEGLMMKLLHLMSSGSGETQTGMLIPVPCLHTLPMAMDDSGVKAVPYELTEEQGWALDMDKLRQALEAGRRHCEPRAIYISNPGDPTGHVQDRETIEKVIRFAATEHLVLLAIEVHQDSVCGPGRQFVSYKKVLSEMGKEYVESVELISVHSISTACMGECGLRGAYAEVLNFDPEVHNYMKRLQITSPAPILPQLALDVLVNPPKRGDPSYTKYADEILQTQTTLSQNAQRACAFLNALPGISCHPAAGGVFLYPRLNLPRQFIEEAKAAGLEPDVFYCQRLLRDHGVCLGPGSENGQSDQNYHVRLSFAAPADVMDQVLSRLRSFHLRLLDECH